MADKIGIIKASSGEGLRRKVIDIYKWLSPLGYGATGFVIANSSVFGGISPFAVAFCAALNGVGMSAAALGAIIGYILSAAMIANMKYMASILLVAASSWLFGANRFGKTIPLNRSAMAMITTFVALMVSGAAVAFSTDYTLYDLLLDLSEVLLACGAAYFFSRAATSTGTGWNRASKSDISCVVISLAIVVTGFAELEVSHLSVGRMLSILCILLCARYGGEAGGSIAGVTAGIAMCLAGGDITYIIAAYGFGGLIAGVFGGAGRVATAASFIVVGALVSFLTQDTVSMYYSVIEAFIAAAVFAVIPQNWVSRLRPVRVAAPDENGYAGSVLRDRLEDISHALSEIGATTQKVSEGLERIESPGYGEVAAKAVDRVCRRCVMKTTCWQFSHKEAMGAMNEALDVLKRGGSIKRDKTPKYFVRNCRRLDDLLTELNIQFQAHTSREGVQRKVAQVRSVITDQFEGLSMMMGEVASEICGISSFDESKARRVQDYFERQGFGIGRVQAYSDESDRMCVAFTIPNYQVERMRRTKAALDLCGLFEAEFDLPVITARKQYATVIFTEKATFTVETGAYQISEGSNRLCGDAYDYIKNKSGRAHFVLSDGMGSGGNAAVDSSMASGLITQLISVGVSHEAALKMVNSALMIKSGEESLATVDVTTVDLYTGRADFYKAGAAPTYLLKNGKAMYVQSSSLPAGILRGVAFERSVMALRENDVVVMVSDGVTATGTEWVKSELESLRSADMQRLCEKLASTAKARRTDNHEDDITVLAAAIRRN